VELVIPVEGGAVWAEDTGGDATPLVLMHPGWGDSTISDPMMARLAARYRVIRYDERGFGRSPASAVPHTQLADRPGPPLRFLLRASRAQTTANRKPDRRFS
jgi:3-oxoadipate enol-lactonase